jgi:Ca2+-binding RTX toxin-like protein
VITGTPPPVDGADTINGGDGNDYIHGNEGNDILNGNDGIDRIYGDDGDDQIDGGAGDDANHVFFGSTIIPGGLYGGDGNDTINGGDGIDYARGGAGNDTISGGAGDDSTSNSCGGPFSPAAVGIQSNPQADLCMSNINGGLYGGTGDDTIHGDDGNDHISGGDGNDVLDGGDGSDYVSGGNGDDIIDGGAGDDAVVAYIGGFLFYGGLYGGAGNDTINGGPGIDYADGGAGDDTIDGGDGNDALQLFDCPVNQAQSISICSVAVGGLNGGEGNDTIEGGAGADYVNGGDGNDNVDGGAGDDRFDSTQIVQPAELNGSDFPGVYGGNGDDIVHGGDGNDDVHGGNGADHTYGDAGDDNIDESADGSPDVVQGGSGVDALTYYSCCNSVTITLDDQADDGEAADPNSKDPGDPGNNFASDLENINYVSNCNDAPVCSFATPQAGAPATLVGNASANLIWGSWGNDDITGGAGADYMSGGYGDDTFHARDGYPDYVDCGDGIDTAIVDQFDTVHNCENVDVAYVKSAFDLSNPPTPPAPQPQPLPPVKDTTPPVVTLDTKGSFTAEQLVLGIKVSFSCNEDCALSLRLLAQQAPGSATFSRVKGYNVVVGRRTVGFGKAKRNVVVRPCERTPGGPQSKVCLTRFKKALNARLAKAGKVTMKLYTVTVDRSGNRTKKTKTITIRRPVR